MGRNQPDVRIANLAKEVFKHLPLATQLWYVVSPSGGYIELFSMHEKTNGKGVVKLTTTISFEDFGQDRYYFISFAFNNNEVFKRVDGTAKVVSELVPMYSKVIKEFKEVVKQHPINSSVSRSAFVKGFGEALADLYMQNKDGAFILDRVPNKTNAFQVSISLHKGNRQFERVSHQVDVIKNVMTVTPLTHVGNTGMKFQYNSVGEIVQDLAKMYH